MRLPSFGSRARRADGERQKQGGDSFFVSIRGRGAGEMVRAKVIDNLDGTYAVGYKPIHSGRYAVSISLLGEPLPGSPFTCAVSTPTPSAPHCVLRGTALQTAIARKEETL
jgi:hypothetical protein